MAASSFVFESAHHQWLQSWLRDRSVA